MAWYCCYCCYCCYFVIIAIVVDVLVLGFGENSRVLKWICERVDNADTAASTPIGYVPKTDALDTSGLNVSEGALKQLFAVDRKGWQEEVTEMRTYLKQFGNRVPAGITKQLDSLEKRLSS